AMYHWDGEQVLPLDLDIRDQIIAGIADHQGNLWLGTSARGLRYVDLRRPLLTIFADGEYMSRPPVAESPDSIWVCRSLLNPENGQYFHQYFLYAADGTPAGDPAHQKPHNWLIPGLEGEKWLVADSNNFLVRLKK
ncbi:hypothetical protein RZS08_35480, partial [Arthrospira platensis SPKY1]|nr:hypothetical protein [Arthrospira platensis SPKY1]